MSIDMNETTFQEEFKWVWTDPIYAEDDILLEDYEGWSLYAVSEAGFSGYGVLREDGYWTLFEDVGSLSSKDAKVLNEAQYQEAMRFGNRESKGQLSLLDAINEST